MANNRKLISNGNPSETIVGFSRAVRVGQFIAVAGTAPVDKNGKAVGVGDVFLQTKQCSERALS
ncbi:MAG: enamine deaminase RidA (YjgF/YER057c/UK114 family) [Yoonia sp.]|jgi:enamine deaminase RidA (YjgF/YER057c/UK114 family)